MNRIKIKKVLIFAVMAISMTVTVIPLGAATLTEISSEFIYSQNSGGYTNFPISVYPGKTSYAGTGAGGAISGDFDGSPGSIFGYRFFNANGTDPNLVTIAKSDPNIIDISPAVAFEANGTRNWGQLWTVSDPDVNAPDFDPAGIAYANQVSGTIDISGVSEGAVYFIYGAYRSGISVDVTISGAGQPDVSIISAGYDWANNWEILLTRIDFVGAADYDTLSYTYYSRNSDKVTLRPADNSGFMGVIIDAVDAFGPTFTMIDKATWSGEGVLMDPSALNNDPGQSPLEFTWNVVSTPVGVNVDISDPAIENPTVTITKDAPIGGASTVTLSLAVNNQGKPALEKTLLIDVYDNDCQMALTLDPATADLLTDFNKNCVTGMDDIAEMASAWLVDYTPIEALIKP